jgi:hypothetical protein
MSDQHQRFGPARHRVDAAFEVCGVQGGEAFVQGDELGVLEDGAGNVEAALRGIREGDVRGS